MLRTSRILLLIALLLAVAAVPALAQDGGSLQYGQIVSGQISNAAPRVSYSLNGTAGDTIYIRMSKTVEGLDSYLNLLNPDGSQLAFDDDGGGNLNALLGPVTLPASGVYTVVATRCCGDSEFGSEGSYELVVDRAQVQPLVLNQPLQISVSGGQPYQFFSYTPAGNELVYLTLTGVSGDSGIGVLQRTPEGYLNYLVDNNPQIPPGYNASAPFPLFAGVEVRFIVRQSLFNVPANAQAVLTLASVPVQPLTLESALSGTLSDATPVVAYQFTANAGDLLRLEASHTGTQGIEVLLLNPRGFGFYGSNTQYVENNTLVNDPLQLPETGQYTVVVRRWIEPEQVLTDASFTLLIGASRVPELAAGTPLLDNVGDETTFERVYRYQGSEGQQVRITLRSASDSYAPGFNLQPPFATGGGVGGGGGGGSALLSVYSTQPGTVTYELRLPATGIYLLRINNGTGQPGDFELLIEVTG